MKIIITESQLKSLILEQQKIKVTDKCGKTQEFDYQKWYYNGGQVARSDLKCYTWDGKSYVYNYSCHFKNWTSMTKEQRDTAISGVKRTCVGSYKDNPNMIKLTVDELKKVLTFENIVDLISIGLTLIPGGAPFGKALDVAQAITYLIKGLLSTTIEDKASNLVNGIFQTISLVGLPTVPLPSFVANKIKYLIQIQQKIGGFEDGLSEWERLVYGYVGEIIGGSFNDYAQKVITDLLTPLLNAIAPYNENLKNNLINVIVFLKKISSNISTAKMVASKIKQQDSNAFT